MQLQQSTGQSEENQGAASCDEAKDEHQHQSKEDFQGLLGYALYEWFLLSLCLICLRFFPPHRVDY